MNQYTKRRLLQSIENAIRDQINEEVTAQVRDSKAERAYMLSLSRECIVHGSTARLWSMFDINLRETHG